MLYTESGEQVSLTQNSDGTLVSQDGVCYTANENGTWVGEDGSVLHEATDAEKAANDKESKNENEDTSDDTYTNDYNEEM